ncbi:MAG: hypothetical protein QOD73_2944 [Solirubrobacteraceae bacterium]|jgi:hypothetical protein|nr:hypothetical protein [Solirubrobacteraceae bacterium]
MDARTIARLYGAGRVVLGVSLLVAPRPLGRVWLGRAGGSPAGSVALRALGARDVILGGMSLHTLDHPQVAPRWQRTCAAVDTVDFVATAAARPALPRVGSALVMAMAAGGAAVGAALGSALARETSA